MYFPLKALLPILAVAVGAATFAGCSPTEDDGRKVDAATPSQAATAPPARPAADRPAPLVQSQPSAVLPAAEPVTADPGSITIEAPPTVRIGSPYEILVRVGDGAGIGDVGLTVQFDPDVLQARIGMKGDWASGPGANERFDATVSNSGDRVQIHSTVAGRHAGGGVLAIVQFEAVGRGTTVVTLSNVTVKDASGRPVTDAAPMRRVQITAE